MNTDERSRDLYEGAGMYPQPPLVPLPPPDTQAELAALGIRPTPLARTIYDLTRAASGFRRFQRELPHRLEQLLRTCDVRGAYLFAPIMAATIALADDPRPVDALDRAATLVLAAQGLYLDLVSGRLPPDTSRGQPLEMGLYHNLFSTCLVVDAGKARLFKSVRTTTVAVAIAGRLYMLELGAPGAGTRWADVRADLARLVAEASRSPRASGEPAPGMLTAADHATQLKVFTLLARSPVNAASLHQLRHAFLTICLDLEAQPQSYDAAATLAHSGNCANRWFHSSLQLVVFGNGRACAICNFSAYLDGNTMMRAAMELQRRASACPVVAGRDEPARPLSSARALDWQIDPGHIRLAERDLQPVLDPQQAVFTLEGLGRRFFKDRGGPPVTAFILALQLATARLLGEPARVDQFLVMSRYRHMDLTTADVTTPATRRLIAALIGDRPSPPALSTLLAEAIESQDQLYHQARQHLPFDDVLALFLCSRTGAQQMKVSLLHGGARMALHALGLQRVAPREVLVSHPEIYPEAPIVGRPGVRLPYVRYFGLHYQILDDKTIVVVMPAIDWSVPNTRLIAELRASLEQIGQIFVGEEPSQPPLELGAAANDQ